MSESQEPKGRIGGSFDEFLKEDGSYDDVQAGALKKVVAHQLRQAMKLQKITKVEMARRMRTSRSQLDRLLDPGNDAVSLETLSRAASVVGRRLHMELI